jgi:hypothetical protein
MSGISTADARTVESVLGDCAVTLRRLAEYRLPPALDQRLLWLSENKESLSEAERHELVALVDLVEEKTLEKLQSQATLRRIRQAFPHLASPAK